MNITKSMAEEIAIKMVEPITKRIEELRKQSNQIAYEAIIPTIPQDVLDCYKKHQSYFMVPYNTYVYHGTWEMRLYGLPPFPSLHKDYHRVQIGAEAMERLSRLNIEMEQIKEEKKKTTASIIATLISLRTMKRVKEGFPEAHKYMEEYNKGKCTAVALPIKDILFSLNKYESISN